jgi:hypothetical protein
LTICQYDDAKSCCGFLEFRSGFLRCGLDLLGGHALRMSDDRGRRLADRVASRPRCRTWTSVAQSCTASPAFMKPIALSESFAAMFSAFAIFCPASVAFRLFSICELTVVATVALSDRS